MFIDGPACPIQSCLDKEVIPSRSTMKRRASENIKSSICTSPEKITRKGSISPYQDVSCLHDDCRYRIARNFYQEKISPSILSCANDYIEHMACNLYRIGLIKYFCNTKVSGFGKIFVQ